MGWMKKRMLRSGCNRAFARLETEFGDDPTTWMMAIGLGHPCYPNEMYGGGDGQDGTIEKLRRFSQKPCDAKAACEQLESWLDKRAISTDGVFLNMWSLVAEEFLNRFLDEFAEDVGRR